MVYLRPRHKRPFGVSAFLLLEHLLLLALSVSRRVGRVTQERPARIITHPRYSENFFELWLTVTVFGLSIVTCAMRLRCLLVTGVVTFVVGGGL